METPSNRARSRIKRKDYHVRLSDDERETISKAAIAEGFQSTGAFMRHYALMAAKARLHSNGIIRQSPPTNEEPWGSRVLERT